MSGVNSQHAYRAPHTHELYRQRWKDVGRVSAWVSQTIHDDGRSAVVRTCTCVYGMAHSHGHGHVTRPVVMSWLCSYGFGRAYICSYGFGRQTVAYAILPPCGISTFCIPIKSDKPMINPMINPIINPNIKAIIHEPIIHEC